MSEADWSELEKQVAEAVFARAYDREIEALIEEVRSRSDQITAIEDLWKLHDFLSARRHDIDGKYDYQYSGLIFAFARLVKEGWLKLDEFEGLEPSKRAKIGALARM